jgi:hypothetical protein
MTTDADTPAQPCPHDPDGQHYVGCGCDHDDDVEVQASDVPTVEQYVGAVERTIRASYEEARQLLADKRAQRDAINAEIRQLVDTTDRLRRTVAIFDKAAT